MTRPAALTAEVFAPGAAWSPRLIRRGWLVRRMLLGADVAGLGAAFCIAELTGAPHRRVSGLAELALFLAALVSWVVAAKLYGLYEHDEERPDHSTVDDSLGLFHLITVGSWLFVLLCAVTGVDDPGLRKVGIFWASSIVLVITCRAVARVVCRRHEGYTQNTVIVGAGEVGQLVARKLLSHPEYRLNLLGFVDAAPPEGAVQECLAPILASPDRLPDLVDRLGIERIIIGFPSESLVDNLELIRVLKDLDVQVDIVPRLFEIVGIRAHLQALEGLPLISLPPLRLSRSSLLLKRLFDAFVALFLLVLLAPALTVIAFAVALESGFPVVFVQERVGIGGRIFRIYKFRSMVVDADDRKHALAHLNHHEKHGDGRLFKVVDDPRVTRVGRYLRRWSLDELPQLVNVLRGEMSLVGPRPLILSESAHVNDWALRRLNLKPGITGPWQVVGRDEMPFDEMLNLDYHYVTGWSLFHDVNLMLRTLRAVARPRSAY